MRGLPPAVNNTGPKGKNDGILGQARGIAERHEISIYGCDDPKRDLIDWLVLPGCEISREYRLSFPFLITYVA